MIRSPAAQPDNVTCYLNMAVQIAESFNGTGTAPVPANEFLLTDAAPAGDSSDATPSNGQWSLLGPGDVIRFTASYTVTQTDIDSLQ
jgi:hypothetical protein